MDWTDSIEEKIDHYAQRILEKGDQADEHALGELTIYMCLRRVATKRATRQDLGMLDAINDVLQASGVIEEGQTFLK